MLPNCVTESFLLTVGCKCMRKPKYVDLAKCILCIKNSTKKTSSELHVYVWLYCGYVRVLYLVSMLYDGCAGVPGCPRGVGWLARVTWLTVFMFSDCDNSRAEGVPPDGWWGVRHPLGAVVCRNWQISPQINN